MKLYFQYFFFYLYRGYQQNGEKSMPGFMSILFMSTIFTFNFITLYSLLIISLKIPEKFLHPYIGVVAFLLILSLNCIYFYLLKGKEKVVTIFNQADTKALKQKRTGILSYIVLSIVLIILVVYFRVHHII